MIENANKSFENSWKSEQDEDENYDLNFEKTKSLLANAQIFLSEKSNLLEIKISGTELLNQGLSIENISSNYEQLIKALSCFQNARQKFEEDDKFNDFVQICDLLINKINYLIVSLKIN